jgi:hypothetical protein
MKKLIVLLIVAMVMFCFAGTAFADGMSPMGTPAGTAGISSSGRNVTYSAITTSAEIEDIITVTAFLQEYRSGTWYDISSVANTKYNTVSVSTSRTVAVSGGHYYRTRGIHTTTNDGVLKTTTSYSPQQWVS